MHLNYISRRKNLHKITKINGCYNLSEPAAPLKSNLRLDCFEIYMRDTGLLMPMFEDGIQKDILN